MSKAVQRVQAGRDVKLNRLREQLIESSGIEQTNGQAS